MSREEFQANILKKDPATIQTVISNHLASANMQQCFPLPKEYLEFSKYLEKKYRDIRWLPIDVPKIKFSNPEEFKRVWEEESIDSLRVATDVGEIDPGDDPILNATNDRVYPHFKNLFIYKVTEDVVGFPYTWKLSTHPIFQEIIDQVKTLLPFFSVFEMNIFESQLPIPPHFDQRFFFDYPTEFRVMIDDDNSQPTFYVIDTEHKELNFVDLPEDTNTFCWSNKTQLHGSTFFGNKKHILVIAGMLDLEKLDVILERSIEKYQDKLNYRL